MLWYLYGAHLAFARVPVAITIGKEVEYLSEVTDDTDESIRTSR